MSGSDTRLVLSTTSFILSALRINFLRSVPLSHTRLFFYESRVLFRKLILFVPLSWLLLVPKFLSESPLRCKLGLGYRLFLGRCPFRDPVFLFVCRSGPPSSREPCEPPTAPSATQTSDSLFFLPFSTRISPSSPRECGRFLTPFSFTSLSLRHLRFSSNFFLTRYQGLREGRPPF